jgi:hypothetical protein
MDFLTGIIIAVFLFSCTPSYTRFLADYRFPNKDSVPDYGLPEYWAALPFKKNPSDSIPKPLQAQTVKDTGVDVFFIHPTTSGSFNGSWNADINDSVINAKTDYTTILYQASAFNECRVFAPRYRQANIRAYFSPNSDSAKESFDIAYSDVRRAFQYYLDNYNQGRPIIIASHSQGTTHAERLIKELFDGKPLSSRLVVAYLVGMPIVKGSFRKLAPCQDSTQTGCFVGWRTFRWDYEPPLYESGESYVCNPLTWTTDTVYAPHSLNLGAVLTKFNRIVPEAADAEIHHDFLWIHKPHYPGSLFYFSRNYHIGDINLFYVNIRQNLRTRIRSFSQSKKSEDGR